MFYSVVICFVPQNWVGVLGNILCLVSAGYSGLVGEIQNPHPLQKLHDDISTTRQVQNWTEIWY